MSEKSRWLVFTSDGIPQVRKDTGGLFYLLEADAYDFADKLARENPLHIYYVAQVYYSIYYKEVPSPLEAYRTNFI